MSEESTPRMVAARDGRRPMAPVAPSAGPLRPLGLDEVRVTGGFWSVLQQVNRERSLPHIGHWLRTEGWVGNFELAAEGRLPEGRRGRSFADSEVYKYLEALAWEIGRTADPVSENEFRALVDIVASAQAPDGYLNTAFGRPGQAPRWSDLEWGHELYCLGHLFQAAVARERTRPGADDGLLGVAVRAADMVYDVFGPDGTVAVCGHPEVETALVELARVIGTTRYLELAALFVERRGTGTLGPIVFGQQYFQDDARVRDADVLRGHAVRANYLAAGATDVAVEAGDEQLLMALVRQWDNTVARRTYITGGQGSHHDDEAFGDDYELPPDRAYSETCAGVASVMFSWRLLLARGDTRYGDLIERTLYNVVATSPSADGTAFYYANTLHQRTPGAPADTATASTRAASSLRAPWFEVSCCPPNVARTLASIDAIIASTDESGLQLHQYAESSIRAMLPTGQVAALRVSTDYPASGVVRVEVLQETTLAWTLSMRVPSWAGADARLRVLTADGAETHEPGPGWATARRAFRAGDVVELDLPMNPRLSQPDPRIDAVRGCVAVERGPEVFCLESVDLAQATSGAVEDVADVRLERGSPVAMRDGRPVVRLVAVPSPAQGWWPYGDQPLADASAGSFEVPLVPYHDWAQRGPSTMRVWLPVA